MFAQKDADGQDFAKDSELVHQLVNLLQHDLRVAIVTAASYGGDSTGYEQRLSGLLSGFQDAELSAERLARFFVLGKRCIRSNTPRYSDTHTLYCYYCCCCCCYCC